MKNMYIAGLCSLALPVAAEVAIDATAANVQFAGKDSIQLNNLTVPGYGAYNLRFKWSPDTLSFVFDPGSLVAAAQSRCVKQVYERSNSTSDHIMASTRTVNGVEYGGFSDVAVKDVIKDWTVTNIWNNFTVAWARTAKIEDNPYLVGQSVAKFDPVKAYGVVTTFSQFGFAQNDLVEIGGNLETDDFLTIKQVNGSNNVIFNKGQRRVASLGCVSGTGTYFEHSSTKSSVVIVSDSGSFVSAYNTLKTSWSVADAIGVVGASDDSRTAATHSYGGLTKGDKLLVRDIGNGFSMVAVDAAGKALGSFLVMTMY